MRHWAPSPLFWLARWEIGHSPSFKSIAEALRLIPMSLQYRLRQIWLRRILLTLTYQVILLSSTHLTGAFFKMS